MSVSGYGCHKESNIKRPRTPKPILNPFTPRKVPYVQLTLEFMSALDTFTSGRAGREEWGQVRNALNLASIIDHQVWRNGQEQQIDAGHNAHKASWIRYQRTGKFGYSAAELQAVRAALEIHGAQLQEIKYVDFDRAVLSVMQLEQRAIKLAKGKGNSNYFAINMSGDLIA